MNAEVSQILRLDPIESKENCRVVIVDCLYKGEEVSALTTTGFIKETEGKKREIAD